MPAEQFSGPSKGSVMGYPNLVRIRQRFERQRVEDVSSAVPAALEPLDLGRRIRPGQSVALTAGSRGIANIPLILRATADYLKPTGDHPLDLAKTFTNDFLPK